MKNAHDIILRPVVTERSMSLLEDKTYTFEGAPSANKIEIKKAVEEVFPGTKVESVNTMRIMGKVKRQGATSGRRPERKKAIVKLTPKSKGIEFFEGLQ